MTPDLAELGKLADACIHCGLCLPACPTYAELGSEPDSPRGRIYLMRALIEGRQQPTPDVLVHLDRCLGCRACETACPSGVRYGHLLEGTRAAIAEPARPPGPRRTFWRRIIRTVLPDRRRFAWMIAPLRLLARSDTGWLPGFVRRAIETLPPPVAAEPLPGFVPARPAPGASGTGDGLPRLTAGFLAGCAMPVLFPHVNTASVRLLAAAGFDVRIPPEAGCCGALQAHDGDAVGAHVAAGRTMAAFADCDRLVTNSAGCGAAMKDYPGGFGAKVRDLSEALLEADWWPDRPLPGIRAVYHDPCHLSHGQGVRSAPRELLRRAGLLLAEASEPDLCCGGAGSYTLLQPELSNALMRRKARNLAATDPELVVTANPSCLMQIRAGLAAQGKSIPVLHLAEILARTLTST